MKAMLKGLLSSNAVFTIDQAKDLKKEIDLRTIKTGLYSGDNPTFKDTKSSGFDIKDVAKGRDVRRLEAEVKALQTYLAMEPWKSLPELFKDKSTTTSEGL